MHRNHGYSFRPQILLRFLQFYFRYVVLILRFLFPVLREHEEAIIRYIPQSMRDREEDPWESRYYGRSSLRSLGQGLG